MPEVTSSEIVGLLEYLDARGGKAELFTIVNDTNQQFGHMINVVKAAEMLEFAPSGPTPAGNLDKVMSRFATMRSHA